MRTVRKIGVICGGSGSSKFGRAIADYSEHGEKIDAGYIANVADNFWYHGMYVCPDVDILTYALSGYLDTSKGWGTKDDAFLLKKGLSLVSGTQQWFGLGDFDSAISLERTELLNKGWTLSSVTNHFCKMLGVNYPVVPVSDDTITTFIHTTRGRMHLQEYWVKHKADAEVTGVEHFGAENARPNAQALNYLSSHAIICPANPITSILPSIKIKKIEQTLSRSKVVAISPFVGDAPFSGPAGKLMKAISIETNSFGVAKLYSKFLDTILWVTTTMSSFLI